MLQLTPQSTIYLATVAIDFRKGIDGLVAVCREHLQIEPLDGAIFMFYNKTRNCFKILNYDGQGFWLCTKRLSSGKFLTIPDKSTKGNFTKNHNNYLQLCHRVTQVLINNGDPTSARFAKNWRKL
jgi:transposase